MRRWPSLLVSVANFASEWFIFNGRGAATNRGCSPGTKGCEQSPLDSDSLQCSTSHSVLFVFSVTLQPFLSDSIYVLQQRRSPCSPCSPCTFPSTVCVRLRLAPPTYWSGHWAYMCSVHLLGWMWCSSRDFFLLPSHDLLAVCPLWPLTPDTGAFCPTHHCRSLDTANPIRTSGVCYNCLHGIYVVWIHRVAALWLAVGPNKVGGSQYVRLLFFSLHASLMMTWSLQNENTSALTSPAAGWGGTDRYCWAALWSSTITSVEDQIIVFSSVAGRLSCHWAEISLLGHLHQQQQQQQQHIE